MTLWGGFFSNSLFVTDEKGNPIMKVVGDRDVAAKLDEVYRKNPDESGKLTSITVIDSDLSSFLVSIHVLDCTHFTGET